MLSRAFVKSSYSKLLDGVIAVLEVFLALKIEKIGLFVSAVEYNINL